MSVCVVYYSYWYTHDEMVKSYKSFENTQFELRNCEDAVGLTKGKRSDSAMIFFWRLFLDLLVTSLCFSLLSIV